MKEDQILKLSGGGDWHIAYILLYAPRRLEKMKEEEEKVDQKVGLLSPRARARASNFLVYYVVLGILVTSLTIDTLERKGVLFIE